jgi:cytochrome c5
VSDLDRRFFDTFAIVLGGLVVFTIVIYFIAQVVSGNTQEVWAEEEREQSASLEERIAPVGTVALPGETPEAAPGAAPAATPPPADGQVAATGEGAAAAPASGEETYNGTCFACHAVGVAGAPKLGDKADWEPRIAQGMDTLVQHAVQGYQGSKGVMPPKGGRADLSDEAVAAAVQYMVDQAK